MSHDIYLCRYKKDEVPVMIRNSWNFNKSVSHIDDIYGLPCHENAQYLFFMRTGPCMEALKTIAPTCAKGDSGYVKSDAEFSLSKEMLESFAEYIITKDYGDCIDIPDHITEQIQELKELIKVFDFDTYYYTIHTD